MQSLWAGLSAQISMAAEGKVGIVLSMVLCLSISSSALKKAVLAHVTWGIPGPCFQLECLESPRMFLLAGAVSIDVLPSPLQAGCGFLWNVRWSL